MQPSQSGLEAILLETLEMEAVQGENTGHLGGDETPADSRLQQCVVGSVSPDQNISQGNQSDVSTYMLAFSPSSGYTLHPQSSHETSQME